MTKAQVDALVSAAKSPQFALGAVVAGPKGETVGTIKAIDETAVTVASATTSARLPKGSLAQGPNGLVIGLTPEQFEAAAKAAGGNKG